MTTEHDPGSARTRLHPQVAPRPARTLTCPCGQDLDVCSGRHCPRCGASLAGPAA